MPGFFPSIHAAASSKQVESTSNNQSQFSNTTYRGAAGSRGAFLCSHQCKRKIKSVAALLSSFFKTIFYNSIFFLHSEFSWWYYLLAFLRASPRHFLCCRMVPDGGCLKKSILFYDYFVPSKEAGNTILKAMALLQSQVNLKEPVGRIYIFKEGRNERKKDDHNDVCVYSSKTNCLQFLLLYLHL